MAKKSNAALRSERATEDVLIGSGAEFKINLMWGSRLKVVRPQVQKIVD